MPAASNPPFAANDARAAAVAAARELERLGRVEEAYLAYWNAGAVEEVARILVQQRRFREAGDVLLQATGATPEQAGQLDAHRKKLAFNAAVCFAHAGDGSLAAQVFIALGERDRAVDVFRKTGDEANLNRVLAAAAPPQARPISTPPPPAAPPQPAQRVYSVQAAEELERNGKHEQAFDAFVQLRQYGRAARTAIRLNRPADAGSLFMQAGLYFESAESFETAGDMAHALESIQRLPRRDNRYRAACVMAIRCASAANTVDFALDHFLADFLTEPPHDPEEATAFLQIGDLYARIDQASHAEESYRQVLAFDAQHRDARSRLDKLTARGRMTDGHLERILKEDESFRRLTDNRPSATAAAMLADLPELPDLPSLHRISPVRPAAPNATIAASAPGPGGTAAWSVGSRSPQPIAGAAAGAPATDMPSGTIVADRYQIDQKIGQGGMAAVYRALDLELNETIALKVFTQELNDDKLIARFKLEVTLSRQLIHPNIVRLYDIGQVGGMRFLTMELLSGSDLRSKMIGQLPISVGIDYLLQICAALGTAHQKGVVHRDIKPANVFLTDDGVIKLMDFGIAKRQATPGLTVAGMIAGTPEYMSPEQIEGFEKVGPSTDLYALGIMAYEMFVGEVPFSHADLVPLLMMQVSDAPPNPRLKNPRIPEALANVILTMLNKRPEDRYATAEDLASALWASVN